MKRATLAECRQQFGTRAVEVLRDLPATPWSIPQMTQLVPELSACAGVLQNHYHHLDVYQHTLEVVAGLERMFGFERFPKWREALRRHFAEPSRIHRLFEKLGGRIPELALLSLADVEAARGPAQTMLALEEQALFVDFLLQQFFEGGFLANPIVPVSVDDLVETFGLTQPKAQKRVLDWLKEGFVDGEFSSQEEGLSLAGEFLETRRIQG